MPTHTGDRARLMQVIRYSPTIRIREYIKDDKRYFTAVIQGWRNFKFVSETIRPQELLDKTLEKCKEIDKQLTDNPKIIETLPSLFKF